MSLHKGLAVEQQARDYLIQQGLGFITNNYRCRCGEVDLIMRDAEYLVFIEVRARSSTDYGGALASITQSKQKKILKTALHYMTVNRLIEKCAARFDVLCTDNHQGFEWIKSAFTADAVHRF